MGTSMRISILACVALLLLGSCTSFRARAYGAYFQPDIAGEAGLANTPGGPAIPTLDVDDSLQFDTDSAPYVRGELGLGVAAITISSFHYGSRGVGTLAADFGVLSATDQVRSEIDFLNIKTALHFDIIDVGPLRISPGFAVDYMDVDMTISDINSSTLERLEVQVPAPMGYVQAELDFGWVAAIVDAGAMRVNMDEVDGDYFDVEGMLRFNVMSNFELFGGYRWITMDATGTVDGQEYDIDLEMSGWFAGGGITF